MLEQRTIEKEISVTGIGIHSGKKVTLKLLPAKEDSGIVFKRVDLSSAAPIKANALNVGATENNTSIGVPATTSFIQSSTYFQFYTVLVSTILFVSWMDLKFQSWTGRELHFYSFFKKRESLFNQNQKKSW